MKIYLLLSIAMICTSFTFAQVNEETNVGSLSGSMGAGETETRGTSVEVTPSGTASLNKEIIQSGYKYTFISNRSFDETLKARWEYRFPVSFPYIVGFSMNVATQEVTITLPETHSSEDLLKLVKRFNYVNYQVN